MPAQAAEAENPSSNQPLKPGDREECPKPTGSHLTPKRDSRGECPKPTQAGRSYDREDLERTGRTDLDQALRQLDPSIR